MKKILLLILFIFSFALAQLTRPVSATFVKADGTPWKSAAVSCELKQPGITPGQLVTTSVSSTLTNSSGFASLTLYANNVGDNDSFYVCTVPGLGSGLKLQPVRIPQGTGTLDLIAAWQAGAAPGTPSYNTTYAALYNSLFTNLSGAALQGPAGPAGAQGPVGLTGPSGATGAVGPQGPIGLTGAVGPAGPKGDTGTAGSVGPQGPIGLTGPQGPSGSQGPIGNTGATGSAGPANTLAIGTVSTGAAGSSASSTITGTAPNQTLNLIIPRGDVGATGSQGIQGIQGPSGATGPAGPGVPTGGTAGQILRKVDGTNFNTEWATPSGGGNMSTATYDTNANGVVDLADAIAWTVISGKPATFPPSTHSHIIGDTTGLQTALDAKLDDSQATAFGLSLLDDASASAGRTTLGLGSAALNATGDFATTVHAHTLADVTDDGTAASRNVPATGNASSTEVVLGSDTRLSDSRTPLAHNQTASTITDFSEASDDRVDALIIDGTNITTSYNDAGNTLTINAAGAPVSSVNTQTGAVVLTSSNIAEGTNLYYTDERNDDRTDALVTDGAGIVTAYNDTANTLTFSVSGASISSITNLQSSLDAKVDDSQVSTFGVSLIDDADAATARATLGLGTAATSASSAFAVAIHSHVIADVTNLQTSLDAKLNSSSVSAFGLTLIDDTSAAVARSTLGLGTAATSNTGDFQAPLVSAANIKTINGSSILGSGDLVVSGGVTDGDKGDISISGSGTTYTVDAESVSITELSDVTTTTPSTGQVLKWNGTAWVNDVDNGGGGSPGGNSGEIQYNNAGAFAGAANVDISAGNLNIVASTPSAAPAGTTTLYATSVAGRVMPGFVGPTALDSLMQPNFYSNKVAFWNPNGNATTVPGVFGIAAPTALGTATSRSVATTNMFTRTRRLGYVSATTAAAFAGHYVAANQFSIGTGSGLGGFFYVARFGASDAATVSGARQFVGMTSSTGVPTNVEPSTLTNALGACHGSADVVLFICYGGSAAQTPISLGANFPVNTLSTDVYELALWASPNAQTVGYRVKRLNTGQIAEGTLSGTPGTQLPAASTLLSHRAWRTNNATLLAVGLDVIQFYIETDY
jgi:hypothetical protein